MTDPYILQAREMLAAEFERQGSPDSAAYYRKGRFDGGTAMTVLARVLREHAEKQPTFEQRVEAMRQTYQSFYATYEEATEAFDRILAEIMAPTVDPLVEAMDELEWCNTNALASDLRKALADRGLEIRESAK